VSAPAQHKATIDQFLTTGVLGSIFLLVLASCQTPPTTVQQPKHLPTYQELATRYNRNLQRIDRLWARAVVELRWHDEQGKHFEQGDGHLIIVLPDQLALSIGKLGNTLFWAGCNPQEYWWFDLQDQPALYFGFHANHALHTSEQLPLSVQPIDLIRLLGILPLAPNPPTPPQVVWADGGYLIQPPNTGSRLLIDPQTTHPTRIELLDPSGEVALVSHLSRWQRMDIKGVPPGGLPFVATRFEMSLVDEYGSMTVFLSDPTDGQTGNQIKGSLFDLEYLRGVFKPIQEIDLDAQHPR